jgi:NAD(P)-dependent dehydrogenase (short-subunit alcohol dehydrogenase family)
VEVAGALAEKVAVVTGASQGIGATIARVLHDAGMAVALLARSEDKLTALGAELGEDTLPVACDVGDPDSVRAAFATIGEHFGRVDLLVNNAGIIGMSLLGDADDAHITSIVAANLLGPMWCSRAAIPLLDAAGGGDIVNISSRAVELARPYLSVYAATKGGLETFTRTLAAELRPQGIRVSSIRVGPTASEPTPANTTDMSEVTDDWVARGGPAPEPPAPIESVAEAILFIATRPRSWRITSVVVDPA